MAAGTARSVKGTRGAQAIDEAVKILEQGAKPEKTMVLQTEEVTKANAAEPLQKYSGK
jgi:ribose transport system substrate-binding protein